MDESEWSSICQYWRELIGYIDVKEMVFYLKKQIEDPPPGTCYSPLDVEVELEEVNEFNDHYAANLLEYLRRRKFGFQLLCNALRYTSQDFLADMLIKTTESIPEVDSPNFYVPASRAVILRDIAERFQGDRCYINLYGERGVGTSCFLEQVTRYLRERCYFTVNTIDLTDTPLILQQHHFLRLKHELVSKEKAMKKFCVFCVDNCNSMLLQQLPEHQKHQQLYVSAWIATCMKELEISLLTTSSHPIEIEGLENIEISRLSVPEMGTDIQRMFPNISDSELKELIETFPEACNPLDCFLMSAIFILNMKKVQTIISRRPRDRDELFAAVFGKLNQTLQNILLSVYALPCNAKVSIPSIYNLFYGSCKPPDELHLQKIEEGVQELTDLNLLRRHQERYSVKDSNFFYHFRTFFASRHPKRLRVFYLRGLHHYLDYTINFIHHVNSLNEFNQAQEKEWKDTIFCISLVLDPSDKSLEQGLLSKSRLCKPVFIKRIFIIEKLRNISPHIPSETLILAAQFLLEDFDLYHYKYADIEDKAKLLCLITDLSLTTNFDISHARTNMQRALEEIKHILSLEKSEGLRVKYYMRILVPLGEIYIKERSFKSAGACFRECLKLKCDNKTINWVLRKRLRYVNEMMKGFSSVEAASPMSPADITTKNFLSQDIAYHLEMGDNFYLRGDFDTAFNYYFELWRKFHSKHLHLKQQEYMLVNLGHLKLQKHPRLMKPHAEDAIKFYSESNTFFKLRKSHDSEFLRICIFTANLLAGHRTVARTMVLEFRNAQGHSKTKFFISITHTDTNHRFLWRELTYSEKENHTNRIKQASVNYYMLEEQHYHMKLNQFKTSDFSRFLEFPSPDVLDNVDAFTPSILYNKKADHHLAIYVMIPTTRI